MELELRASGQTRRGDHRRRRKVCVCVCVCACACACACVCVREKERERESDCVREIERSSLTCRPSYPLI